jgi:hypothetical protein
MVAHERALEWRELFDLAVSENIAQEDIVEMGYRIAGQHIVPVLRPSLLIPTFTSQRIYVRKNDIRKAHVYCSIIRRMFEKL